MLMLQVFVIVLLSLLFVECKPPPGFEKPPEDPDKTPPKYEYGYNIADEKGSGQGKLEARDGEYALGRYYVQGSEASQNVEYLADDWGFHPVVKYSSTGPHSRARAHFALGEEAVNALKNGAQTDVPPNEQVQEAIEKINQEKAAKSRNPPTDDDDTSATVEPSQSTVPINEISVTNTEPAFSQPTTAFAQEDPQPTVFTEPQPVSEVTQETEEFQNQPSTTLSVPQNEQPNVAEDAAPVQFSTEQEAVNLLEAPLLSSSVQVLNLIHGHILQNTESNSFQTNSGISNVPSPAEIILEAEASQQNQNQVQAQDKKDDEVSSLATLERAGGYGSKLNTQFTAIENSQHTLQNRIPTRRFKPSKLVENTNQLITGQDVLNINQVISEGIASALAQNGSLVSVAPSASSNEETKIIGLSVQQSNSVEYNSNRVTSTTASPLLATTLSSVVYVPIRQKYNLSQKPIVVADFEDGSVETQEINHQNSFVSTMQGALDGQVSQTIQAVTEPSGVLITPRPVSSNFLAPITAGVQLQQVEQTENVEQKTKTQNYQIDIQQSQPYYLGMLEYVQYPSGYSSEKMVGVGQNNLTAEKAAMENIQIGTTLLNFPVPDIETVPAKQVLQSQQLEEAPYQRHEFTQLLPAETVKQKFSEELQTNDITVQQLPSTATNDDFKGADQTQQSGQKIEVPVQQLPLVVEKTVEKQVPVPVPSPYPVVQTKYIEKPVEVTKYVNTPIPVHVPVHVPIQVPYPVEKIVEKPFPVTKIVEKPVHVPYPVEKVIEKQIKVPYAVTKFIDRPYPVHVPVPQPYPVEKIVKQPYPVEVRVPVQVPVKVPQPYPVETVIEKKVPVPHYIEKSVPVEVKIPVPVAQPYYIHVPVEVPRGYSIEYPRLLQKPYGTQVVTVSQARPLYQPLDQKANEAQQLFTTYYAPPNTRNAYLPPASSKLNCDQDGAQSTRNAYYDYAGLLPPRLPTFRNVQIQHQPARFRNVRSDFGKNLKLEYGFLPPMVPSLEIDEHGNPVDKKE